MTLLDRIRVKIAYWYWLRVKLAKEDRWKSKRRKKRLRQDDLMKKKLKYWGLAK